MLKKLFRGPSKTRQPSPRTTWQQRWVYRIFVFFFATTSVLLLSRCGNQNALLMKVTSDVFIETFDIKVRHLESGEFVLNAQSERVTSETNPNRDISQPNEVLKVSVEFAEAGTYLVQIIGRSGQGGSGNVVAIRQFKINGLREANVRLIALEHDQDNDFFPACGAYGDCELYKDALSCEYLDCDDDDSFVNPFAEEEVCGNEKDDDCSALCSGSALGEGDEPCTDADGDGSPAGEDCDDTDPCRAPGLKEAKNLCQSDRDSFPTLSQACLDKLRAENTILEPPYCGDGIDQDCNGSDVTCEVDNDCDGSPATADCNDNDPTIKPNAAEVCDGVDNNCDEVIDEGCIPCDVDGDEHASPDATDPSCDLPKDDPDDYDAGIFPGTTSAADDKEGQNVQMALRGYCSATLNKNGIAERNIDHDGDGLTAANDGCPPADCDKDGDGFAAASCDPAPTYALTDCNDDDPTIFPGAPDRCGDGVAQNCSSDIPCGTNDKDGDGYAGSADCNDSASDTNAAAIHPWAVEICDGVDNDCDGLVDEGNPDHEGNLITTTQPTCSDHNQGQCFPCLSAAADCPEEERLTTGICACSRQVPTRAVAVSAQARVSCSGEDESAIASQRCFGANQPQAEKCDERDWDCNGEPDDPDGNNLADVIAGRSCGNDTGTCVSGTVTGCDLSRSLPNIALLRTVLGDDNINEHWICSNETVLPIPERCNGRDDDCNDALPTNEQDGDSDHYLECSGCSSAEVTGTWALRSDLYGCSDCSDGQFNINPGREELCNGVNDDCNDATADGSDECTGATPDCCSIQMQCRNLSTDINNCGDCGVVCNSDVANRCVNSNCVCGDTGSECGAGLNCVDVGGGTYECRCVENGRCSGCCANSTTCVGGTSTSQCGTSGESCDNCNDGNDCTTDSCNSGNCNNANRSSGTSCDSNTGRCDNQDPPQCCKTCLHSDDSCDSTGSSTSYCGSGGEDCDTCTAPECQAAVCDANHNCGTTNVSGSCSSDGIDCTNDICQGGSCQNILLDSCCEISNSYYDSGDTRSGNVCEVCTPATSQSAWSANTGETCDADIYDCTDDVCDGISCSHPVRDGECLIDSQCYEDGDKNPLNSCEICESATSKTAWTDNDGESCDTLSCTDDVCNGNVCEVTLQSGNCLIGGVCYSDSQENPSEECQICDSSVDDTDWSEKLNYSGCTADGMDCTFDRCMDGLCEHPPRPGRCYVEGTCYDVGDYGENGCGYCESGTIDERETLVTTVGHTCYVFFTEGTCDENNDCIPN